MQVFARVNDNKIITLEVTGDNTIRELVALALNKQYSGFAIPADERIRVRYQNRTLALNVTLTNCNVQKETTFSVVVLPAQSSLIDNEVLGGLQQFLHVAAAETNTNEITFIGVGSYDNGHHNAESITRQQCPTALLEYCLKNRVDLNIIFIDPGFKTDSVMPPQVYHSGEWALLHKELGGKIRQYKHQPAVARMACDIWLTTFATGIAEYGSDLKNQGRVVATIDLPTLFSAVTKYSGTCLICGNFYASPTDTSQFFTLGDEQTICATGFDVNPPH
ncbi:hypothetical protein [Pseudomonas sp. HS6]|uniref:hypothetical protein n=1 Tax=Pseudomonas sp. HS6 TaxID=2850559 RepID=UPI002018888B|nr:hypothetical protein [Pseudomonas sp. HS6]UQS16836.1 hypothetical protein JJN09_08270 [Pseudomonas sp. HS6]